MFLILSFFKLKLSLNASLAPPGHDYDCFHLRMHWMSLLLIISCTRNVRIWQTRVRHIYKVLCIISARHQRFSRHRLPFTLTIVTSRHIEHNHDNISYPQQACWHTMDWSDRGLRAERNISVHRQGRGFRGKVWICYRLDVGVAIVMSTCVLVHADFKFKHHNSMGLVTCILDY